MSVNSIRDYYFYDILTYINFIRRNRTKLTYKHLKYSDQRSVIQFVKYRIIMSMYQISGWLLVFTILSANSFGQCPSNVADLGGGDFTGYNEPASCTDLPVELISFTTGLLEYSAVLKWSTASELTNEGFYIERSVSGNEFEEIGFVVGNGIKSPINHYSFEDTGFSRSSYYRLRQVGYAGAFEYSDTLYQSSPKNRHLTSISIYPNPNFGRIQIEKTTDEVYMVSMIDMRGIQVLKPTSMDLFETENKLNQILPYLTNGLYLIRFTGQNRSFESRIALKKQY